MPLNPLLRDAALLSRQAAQGLSLLLSSKPYIYYLSYDTYNWGDALNKSLLHQLTNFPCWLVEINLMRYSWYRRLFKNQTVLLAIGSILQHVQPNSVVWGSGIMDSNRKLAHKPKEVLAVRGPLTAKVLEEQDIHVPKVYGDPALLYPQFYRPNCAKQYKLGIIPHRLEINSPLFDSFKRDPAIRIISIYTPINDFLDLIFSCETIASSSLHGLIAADAYGIPSTWVKFRDVTNAQSSFKYFDYFASLGYENHIQPYYLDTTTRAIDLIKHAQLREVSINLDLLLNTLKEYINRFY